MTLRVADEWATITEIVENKRSIARFGDGEIKLASGFACKTQPHDPVLENRLKEVIRCKDPRLLVGIPRIFDEEPPLATPGFWPQHRARFEALCKGSKQYWSAFITRRDAWPLEHEELYWKTLRRAWEARPVLLVTGSKKGLGTRELMDNARYVGVLEAPRPGAWVAFDRLSDGCMAFAKACRPSADGEPLVVLALGATATVLAHDICRAGVQALDLGHAAQAYARVSPKELEEA